MGDLTFVEPRDGLKSNVRVRRDVHRLTLTECERPEAVEKAPWTDHAPVSDGKRTRDGHPPELIGLIRRLLGL